MLKPIRGTILEVNGDPLCRGLVGSWPCNEHGGRVSFDYSRQGHAMILYGDACWRAGCLYFDGSGNDYAQALLHPDITSTAPWTLVWKSKDNVNEDDKGFIVIQTTNDWTGQEAYIAYHSVTNGLFIDRRGATRTYPATSIVQTDWHTYAVTCPGGPVAVTLYVDGILNSATGSPGASYIEPGKITIGKGDATYHCANCQIDFVYLFNRVLTVSEIMAFRADTFRQFRLRDRLAILAAA